MRFSIIMPVYNAGTYLRAALDSVLSQSFRDFELIVIDDGSTDGSGDVCEEYAKRDRRVVAVRQKNGGICHARNIGMKRARGEFVGFCDHDDEYLPGYLEIIEQAIQDHPERSLDIVKVNRENYKRWPDGRRERCFSGYPSPAAFFNRDAYSDSLFRGLTTVIWNGFYRRDFLVANGLRFDETLRVGGEDTRFMLYALNHARCVYNCGPKPYYRHYENVGTSTSSKSHAELADVYLDSIRYEISNFNLSEDGVVPRYYYWVGLFQYFVYFAQGNELSLFAAAHVIGEYARNLLSCAHKGQGDLSTIRYAWLIRFRLYGVFGLLTMSREVLIRSSPYRRYLKLRHLLKMCVCRFFLKRQCVL